MRELKYHEFNEGPVTAIAQEVEGLGNVIALVLRIWRVTSAQSRIARFPSRAGR